MKEQDTHTCYFLYDDGTERDFKHNQGNHHKCSQVGFDKVHQFGHDAATIKMIETKVVMGWNSEEMLVFVSSDTKFTQGSWV